MAESLMMCLPPQTGLHSPRRERATSSSVDDLAEAPESKGHTLKIPARAGVPLWAWLGGEGDVFGCQQCWIQGHGEHGCLLSQTLEPWNPPTFPTYIATRPSQEGDSTERSPSKCPSVAQSTWQSPASSSSLPQHPETLSEV